MLAFCREIWYNPLTLKGAGLARRHVPISTKIEFFNLLAAGHSVVEASRAVGVSRETGYGWKKQGLNLDGPAHPSGPVLRSRRIDLSQSDPVDPQWLSSEAKRALEDFDYFRARYFGRRATPWQKYAADEVNEALGSPLDEYLVINEPPGSGKSTLFTSDLPIWFIVKDRSVRGLIGSSTQRMAEKYSNRIRRTLERTRPLPENPLQGRPVAAEAALAQDFGRFRPVDSSLWTRSEFVVAQRDTEGSEDKEPTVAAYGMDTEFLGHRANWVVWDDLVTRTVLRNSEQIEQQRAWWTEEGETRLEPGGVLLLVGQRMGADDLYRFCLDMEIPEELVHVVGRPKKYRHIIFPAHFEDKCEGNHGKSAEPWPDGCLLDPVRLPWSKLATVQRNRGEAYRVQYQQEDVDPAEVLVPKLWVDGGTDPLTGEVFPGCWDPGRELLPPPGLAPPVVSYATADPSPTKYWSIQWWLYQPATNQRFLIDLLRQTMDSPDFLDWNENARNWFGVMQDWQLRSKELGYPISHWIVENNAAQRFILQHDHVRRWQRHHQVQIVAHSTHRNKTDPDFGVQMLKNLYRFGQIRLPGGKLHGRIAALKLVDEVTRYPQTATDDCMMAQWFGEFAIANGALHHVFDHEPVQVRRPSWMRRERRKVAA